MNSNLFAACRLNPLTESGIFESSNSGITWSRITSNMDVSCLIVVGNNLIAGTLNTYNGLSNGIYVSKNTGNSWLHKNEGFNNLSISSLSYSNDYIFFSSYGSSVWKRYFNDLININKIDSRIPKSFSLSQNYPNPFNPITKISFQLPVTSFSSLKIYDILGKEIVTLVNEKLSPGTYRVDWNASEYPSGVYFYRLKTEKFTDTKRMLLIK